MKSICGFQAVQLVIVVPRECKMLTSRIAGQQQHALLTMEETLFLRIGVRNLLSVYTLKEVDLHTQFVLA